MSGHGAAQRALPDLADTLDKDADGARVAAGVSESPGSSLEAHARSSRLGVCSTCAAAAAKYTCPRCGVRSCSAPCVAAHKTATACSGKRDVTAYVAIAAMDDTILRSDLVLLEDTERVTVAAKRARSTAQRGGGGGGGGQASDAQPSKPPQHALKLAAVRPCTLVVRRARSKGVCADRGSAHAAQVAKTRGTEVLFQPTGMSRRSSNRSKVEHATQVRNARRGWAQKRYAVSRHG